MKKLILYLLLPFSALAQTAARYDQPAIMTTPAQVPSGSLPPLLAVTNAQVAVCGFPATMSGGMCTNTITTYTDSTLSTACPSTAQLTAPGSNACVPTTGLQGAFGFWYNAATQTHMTYTVRAKWGTFGPYDILLSGSGAAGNPAGPAFAANFANASVNAFQGDANITINPTTHTFTSSAYGHLPTITIPDDCPAVTGNGTTDDSVALQACVNANPSVNVLFRKTQAPGQCDYFFAQPLVMVGGDSQWNGVSGGSGSGTRFCFAADISGIWVSNIKAASAHLHHLIIVGGNPWTNGTLADFVVPQRFGGTGANAVGIIANSNGMTVDHVRSLSFANSGIYVMSSDPLGAPIASATWSGGTATVTTTVGHGCANGMAVAVSGISGLTGSSVTSEVDLTFVNSTTVTFPASGSGSFSGSGAALTCNSFLSTLGLYAIADEGSVTNSYFSNNRGDGIFAQGGDSNDWTYQNNQDLSNQLAGVRDISFLGSAHIREQTDANGWDLTTITETPVAMTSVSTSSNGLTFTSSDPNLISNSTGLKQGSQIQVSGCSLPGPAAITFAQVIPVGGGQFWLQVAIPGFIGGGGNITTSGLSLTGSTGGFNFNGTFSGAEYVTNAASSGVPGLEFHLIGYTGTNTTSQAQTGQATNYPSVATGNWWITSNSGTTWTARRNPNVNHPNVSSISGCFAAVLPGSQVWATANIDGGAGIYSGASGNTVFHPYTEADQRSIKCGQLDRFLGGDVGSGYDPQNCNGSYTQGTKQTVGSFFTPDPNGVAQGNLVTIGGGFDEYDVFKTVETSCTLLAPNEANSCGLTFTHTLPSSFITEDWWGFNGGLFSSGSISTATAYSLLLAYAQTAENSDGNHPPIWVPNAMYAGQTFGTNKPLIEVTWGTAAPTTGTWNAGSIVWNVTPVTGTLEWINTVSGTPGTWVAVPVSGSSGLSGMTAGQVAIAASSSTITSSMPLAGAGAGIPTGPTTTTSGDCVEYTGTSGQQSDSGAPCGGGGGGAVNTVTNSDGTLTISPTTGAVVASINLGHANTWTLSQTFSAQLIANAGMGVAAGQVVSWNADAGFSRSGAAAIAVGNGTQGSTTGTVTGTTFNTTTANIFASTVGVRLSSALSFGWASTTTGVSSAADTVMCRSGAAGNISVESASSCTNTVAGATGILNATVLNALTGFQINSAATSGHYPRGNGTDYVDGTIQAGDVPTLNQSTTGNAATATALASTPTLCSTGNAPTGILANGNATGCAAIGGSSGVSGQAAGVIPLGSTATTIGAQSHMDDGNTTASTITSTEAIAAPSYSTNGSANGSVVLTSTGTPAGTETTNQVLITVPNSVTHYTIEFPAAQPSGSNTFLSCTAANPSVCSFAAGGGSSGLSGMTATQVPIAATSSTVTSSKALAGAGAGITTGPTTSTNLDCVEFSGTTGQIADTGSPCGGSGSPGGSNTDVQFNNSGAFGGTSGLTFNSSTNVVNATGGVSSGTAPTITPGTGGVLAMGTGTCAAGVSSVGTLCFNSADNIPYFNTNAGTTQHLVQAATISTAYTNATTSATNIVGLAFTVAPSTTYLLRCYGLSQAVATGGLKLTLTGPASPTLVTYNYNQTIALSSGAPTSNVVPATGTSYPSGIGVAVTTAATDMPFDFWAEFTNGTNAGTLQLQGTSAAAVTTTVEAGATCTLQ